MATTKAAVSVEGPAGRNMHLEKNLSLGILIDEPGLGKLARSPLFSPNRLFLVRVKSKFIQTMGYSVEIAVDKTARRARVLKHSAAAPSVGHVEEESAELFAYLDSLDHMKRAILEATSEGAAGEKKPQKRPCAPVDSSDEEDESRHKFVQTLDILYPEEALYQMENGNLIIYRVDFEQHIFLPTSVQQCYEAFFHPIEAPGGRLLENEISIDDYIVYSHLIRLGYIVRRHTTTSEAVQKSTASAERKRPDLANVDFDRTPLVSRDDYGRLKLGEVLGVLDFIPSVTIDQLRHKLAATSERPPAEYRALYEVHLPTKTFKKSKPGSPAYCLMTRRRPHRSEERRRIPGLLELAAQLVEPQRTADFKAEYLYSFVNENGEFSFYHFDFKSLPVINELD